MAALSCHGEKASEEDAVRANELLLWLSARRKGSWQQFRQAVEELHSSDGEANSENNDEFPLHQQLRLDLERLAHVEFFAADCEDGWRIAPPTLAAHSVSGGVRGVLCGARSPALRERMVRAAENFNCETLNSFCVPEVIRVVAPDASALAELAAQTNLHFQQDAPLAILSHLPPCDPPSRTRSQSEFPQGADWSIHDFDATKLAWRKVERRETQAVSFGVLRFLIHFQRPRKAQHSKCRAPSHSTFCCAVIGATYCATIAKALRSVFLLFAVRRDCSNVLWCSALDCRPLTTTHESPIQMCRLKLRGSLLNYFANRSHE